MTSHPPIPIVKSHLNATNLAPRNPEAAVSRPLLQPRPEKGNLLGERAQLISVP